MVKADVKRNYYADLEVSNTASVEEIKKQYRKLALAYHPDRNAGKEEEVIPKFQAIQAAHEVLTDPVQKADYDNARRSAGLYPTFNRNRPGAGTAGSTGTTGNPYQASSNFPPPPRRTQPGTYNRPPPYNAGNAGKTPNGADRFSSFPKPSASQQRSDPAQDRTNMFRAWQNMNTPQDRQGRPGQTRGGATSAGRGAPTGQRPTPPPRQGTTYPTEEDIKAGMNYTRGPPPKPPPRNPETNFKNYQESHGTDSAEKTRTAWQSFQASGGKAGVGRSKTTRTPRRGGFDPSAPGSDERPANGSYTNARHKSDDMGRPFDGMPPPPPGPPPQAPGSVPTSPDQSRQRPHPDPLRPFQSREEDAPYSEGNRRRTPYSSFSGEKTDFGSDMRRSASTRDTTKLHEQGTQSGSGQGRHKSTSPPGRQNRNNAQQAPTGQPHRKPYTEYSSNSDGSSDEDSPQTGRFGQTAGSRTSHGRPMATPRASNYSNSNTPSAGAGETSRPPTATDGAQSDGGAFGQRPESNGNMYVNPSSVPLKRKSPMHSFPYSEVWSLSMFNLPETDNGYYKKQKHTICAIPTWALPSTVVPMTWNSKRQVPASSIRAQQIAERVAARAALNQLQSMLVIEYGGDEGLDMNVFSELVIMYEEGCSTGHSRLDEMLKFVFKTHPDALTKSTTHTAANQSSFGSFNFPAGTAEETLSSPGAKSRSEENINTKFSPGGWNGTFQGTGDYFAPPPMAGKKSVSPTRRQGQRSNLRSSTTPGGPTIPAAANEAPTGVPPQQDPTEANGSQPAQVPPSSDARFNKDTWAQTFKEADWVFPPPPPGNPPSPSKPPSRRVPSRKSSRAGSKNTAAGSKAQPHVVDETEEPTTVEEPNSAVPDDIDAMDIDNTPPPARQATQAPLPKAPTAENVSFKGPRLYPIPTSPWHQQQQKQQNGLSTQSPPPNPQQQNQDNLKTNLNDMANVAPFAQYSEGLSSFSDVSASLPFKSAASSAGPSAPTPKADDDDPHHRNLQTPQLPKAPDAPPKLSKRAWSEYVTRFAAYMRAYTTWSETMLNHFVARTFQVDERLKMGNNWLEASGDVTGGGAGGGEMGIGGWAGYMSGLREDGVVREKWVVGCERHAAACVGFEKVRERVRALAANGTLLEG
ncbi:hypothetical protein MBLNU230_g7826t1 [Neophaeotheca triangularis]